MDLLTQSLQIALIVISFPIIWFGILLTKLGVLIALWSWPVVAIDGDEASLTKF